MEPFWYLKVVGGGNAARPTFGFPDSNPSSITRILHDCRFPVILKCSIESVGNGLRAVPPMPKGIGNNRPTVPKQKGNGTGAVPYSYDLPGRDPTCFTRLSTSNMSDSMAPGPAKIKTIDHNQGRTTRVLLDFRHAQCTTACLRVLPGRTTRVLLDFRPAQGATVCPRVLPGGGQGD